MKRKNYMKIQDGICLKCEVYFKVKEDYHLDISQQLFPTHTIQLFAMDTVNCIY